MKEYEFSLKESIKKDFSFCEAESQNCANKIIQNSKEVANYRDNPDFSILTLQDTLYKESEILRISRYKRSIIAKKYVFDNRIIYISSSKFLLEERETRRGSSITLLSKDDPATSDFLDLEIGDQHLAQGQLHEIAEGYEFIELNDELYDLRNVHFQTKNGKDICQSYRELMYGESLENKKIIVHEIFSYKERIQSSEQNILYKVIRENQKKLILVDGQAGSGKSTAAIDALSNEIATIYIVLNDAKKNEVIEYLSGSSKAPEIMKFEQIHDFLQKSMSLQNVKENYKELMEDAKFLSAEILDTCNEVKNILSSDIIKLSSKYSGIFETLSSLIFEQIDVDKTLASILKRTNKEEARLYQLYINSFPFSIRQQKIIQKVKKFSIKLSMTLTRKEKIKKEIKDKITSLRLIHEELMLTRQIKDKNLFYTGKKQILDLLKKITLENEVVSKDKRYINELIEMVNSELFLSSYFFEYKRPDVIYITKQILREQGFHLQGNKIPQSILIDEYQELNQPEAIEILHLIFDRIILVGDSIQSTKKNIYKLNDRVKEIIFTRNFRQTYQLAIASLVIRENISNSNFLLPQKSDYYKDQIQHNGVEYKKPYIKAIQDIKSISMELIKIIGLKEEAFEGDFPIVVIYHENERVFINALKFDLKDKGFKCEFTNSILLEQENINFLFMTLEEVKGKEAPIIIYISMVQNIDITNFYISITRSQFEFYAFIEKTPTWIHDYNSYFEIENDHSSFVYDEAINPFLNKASTEQKQKKIFSRTKQVNDPVKDTKNSIKIENEFLRSDGHQSGKKQVINNNATVDDQSKPMIEPSILTNQNMFKESYRKKREDKLQQLAERSKSLSSATKTIVIKEKITKIGAEETKDFFRRREQYAGHCQICGFSFKTKKNFYYCERFTWTDYKKGKWTKAQKELLEHKIIDAGNSLCLCAKCHSIIKQGGDFEAIFLNDIFDRIGALSDDEILQSIHSNKQTEVPDIFRDHVDFNDMYALPIRLLGKNEHLYFTEIHLIQFIEFLKN